MYYIAARFWKWVPEVAVALWRRRIGEGRLTAHLVVEEDVESTA